MTRDDVLAGFLAESDRLAGVMLSLPEPDFARPTPCPPWTVAQLLTHVTKAVGRTPVMLTAPEPETADTDAAGYYRPDLFTLATDAERIESAQRDAEIHASGRELAEAFDAEWRRTHAAVSAEPVDRRVVTRHGDRMELTEFMITRVAEVVLHGLDLATALDTEPWTTPTGGEVVERLLLTAEGSRARPRLGWDRPVFLAKATGRAPLTAAEAATVRELGITWITLG